MVLSSPKSLYFTSNLSSSFAPVTVLSLAPCVTLAPGLVFLTWYASADYNALITSVRARYLCPNICVLCGWDCAHSPKCFVHNRRKFRFGGLSLVAMKGIGGKPAMMVFYDLIVRADMVISLSWVMSLVVASWRRSLVFLCLVWITGVLMGSWRRTPTEGSLEDYYLGNK